MSEKICLVTGANRGIGRATALELAITNARVVLVCRSRELGEAACSAISDETGNPAVELLVADLSSMESIRRLADGFRRRYPALHILVHNAGVARKQFIPTQDAFETTFAVNHLAPYLLTCLLMDRLLAGTPARVICVSSIVHKWGKIDFEDLMGAHGYDIDRAYNQSKLANILFTRELARRLEGTGVTANSLEPGMTATDFGREYTGFKAFMSRLWKVFMKSPAESARAILFLATAPELERISGRHFAGRRKVEPSAGARDPQIARRLWEVSAKLTGVDPAVELGAVQNG